MLESKRNVQLTRHLPDPYLHSGHSDISVESKGYQKDTGGERQMETQTDKRTDSHNGRKKKKKNPQGAHVTLSFK